MTTENKLSLFERMRAIDCKDIIQTNSFGNKDFKYISWADAWAMLKKHFPDASFHYHTYGEQFVPFLQTSQGAFVSVSVTVEGVCMTETLPVMDAKNHAISEPDARDINDSLKRCLVKAIALHGLGLSCYEKDDIYAREHPRKELELHSTPLKEGAIDLGPKSPITGKTYEQAWVSLTRNGSNLLEESLAFWKSKTLEKGSKPEQFVKAAEAFLKAKRAVKDEQPPPPTDWDMPF